MQSTYSMSVGTQDAYRLSILNRVYNPYSMELLKNIPINDDARIIDFGCGTAQLSIWMAKNLTPNGKVYAVDASQEQLNIARDEAAKANVNNIEFIHSTIDALPDLKEKVDLVTSRLLLIHLAQPQKALQKMLAFLKPGGYLVCEDASLSRVGAYPASEALNTMKYYFKAHLMRQNKNPDMGLALLSMFKALGVENIQYQISQPILSTPEEKSLMYLSLSSIYHKLQELNLIDEKKYYDLIYSLRKDSSNIDQLYLPASMVQISAVKI